MRLVDADSLKENGFVVPKTLKKGDMYLEVKAEDVATETAPVRRFFINDKIIDAIPTIEAEPIKHGHWLKNGDRYCECSVCHHEGNISGQDNYCWYCGARMDEVDNG